MIKLEKIQKNYSTGNRTENVLKEINLTIEKGEMLAITGRSGTGKSTLLHILGGMELPTNGKYYFSGKEVASFNYKELASWRKENIGFILQNYVLIEEKNIFDNVALPLLYAKKSKGEIKSKVFSLLEQLGLEDKAYQYPHELSGGQAQRVAIARALVNDPELILADEPTGSLDTETEKNILNIFKKINDEGKTFILVTHDETVSSMCNRTVKIIDGYISEKM
ncbi:ABC transporter ATP-binding protein [Bacillus thuringiensis]|uniref:Peptide ABC transporter ATP-binding protein n=1 Tax=Bacillus thuringiensis subsp. jegathesan TaxID=56955 RepID=A0A9X6QXW3_BACTJ|nr:ABC transporter ATP-binding protein [Bacillus thuringiensis]OUB63547.1 peptide ABC transporter ATP-binding protein [Bacillus thuringiensis serovar jegathesan]